MIKNIDQLTSEQKNDLQEFVSIGLKNKNLWWENGDLKKRAIFDYLKDTFSEDIDFLNDIFIEFPDEETKMVLQILSELQCANDFDCVPGDSIDSDHHELYAFRFKKHEDVVKVDPVIIDLGEFDTKQLLEELQTVLHGLKTGEFVDLPPWVDRYKKY